MSGEYFCSQEISLVRYPTANMDSAENLAAFCQNQKARVVTDGDMKCVEDFRSLILSESGHFEQNFTNQLCVVSTSKYITHHCV